MESVYRKHLSFLFPMEPLQSEGKRVRLVKDWERNLTNLCMSGYWDVFCLNAHINPDVSSTDVVKHLVDLLAGVLLVVSLLLCVFETLSKVTKSQNGVSETVSWFGEWLKELDFVLQGLLDLNFVKIWMN